MYEHEGLKSSSLQWSWVTSRVTRIDSGSTTTTRTRIEHFLKGNDFIKEKKIAIIYTALYFHRFWDLGLHESMTDDNGVLGPSLEKCMLLEDKMESMLHWMRKRAF